MNLRRFQEYERVKALRPGRSVFDLSYAKKFSGKLGYLYPVYCEEMVPGDVFQLGSECVVRFAPLVAPVLHEIVLKADWYFVPYRILYSRTAYGENGQTVWEEFITGGNAGTSTKTRSDLGVLDISIAVPEGGLWDYLGIPTGVALANAAQDDSPLKFPGMAYRCIYNNYYRDPNLESELDVSVVPYNEPVRQANWDADYFTRALPWQQRGTAPAFPISGTTHAVWTAAAVVSGTPDAMLGAKNAAGDNQLDIASTNGAANVLGALNNNTVNLGTAVTFNVSDLRLGVQLQRWLERNARSGARYVEFLRAHYGASPRDDRLQRPEYIGGIRQNVVVSEVIQTSAKDITGSTTPPGFLSGHGITAGRAGIGRYHAQEFGIIMCMMSVQPRPAYQQGIARQWLRRTKYDWYSPEFANLSEQAVQLEEVYLQASQASNLGTFGYQGRYDEMRSRRDEVAGAFRSSLNYWHFGRIFGSAPSLNSTFGHVDPSAVSRPFASTSADNIYVHWGNSVKAIRPMPMQSEPGLMDHDFGGR